MANAAARRQWVVLAAFVAMGLVGVGCRAAADIDAATPTTVPVSTTTTTNDGAPTPTTSSSDRDEANPWPSVRPSDLHIDWGVDGGSAPWFEDLRIAEGRATWSVFMDGLEYHLQFTPSAERLDELYRSIRDGRFDLYEVVPFADGEMIYDAESEDWSVRAGDVRHRLGTSGQDIASPGLGATPLADIARFVDLDRVPDATVATTIVIDDTAARHDLWGIEVSIDFGAADLAIGDDRWTDRLQVALTADVAEASVRIVRDQGDEPEVEYEGTLRVTPGSDLVLTADRTGALRLATEPPG